MNNQPEKQTVEGGKGFRIIAALFDYIEILVFSVVAVLLVFSFVFRYCEVDGRSMRNTLYDEERIVTTNLFYEPKQGDIVVFHLVNNSYQKPLVKRVIATEGQEIAIDFAAGTVSVDGVVLEEDYVYLDSGSYNIRNDFDMEKIITDDNGHPVFKDTVPEGKLFVMGDNRNHSTDSRSILVGFIDEKCVLGKAVLRISPFTFLD